MTICHFRFKKMKQRFVLYPHDNPANYFKMFKDIASLIHFNLYLKR